MFELLKRIERGETTVYDVWRVKLLLVGAIGFASTVIVVLVSGALW